MHSFIKYISKQLILFISVLIGILILDILVFGIGFNKLIRQNYNGNSPEMLIEEIADNIVIKDGNYNLSDTYKERLLNNDIWALMMNESGDNVWSYNTPESIKDHYSIGEAASFSRGYLNDYPVFVWNMEGGLLVLGYPKGSVAKVLSNYYPVSVVRNVPVIFLSIIASNILILFVTYYISKHRIFKKTEPIIRGIDDIAKGNHAEVNVAGELSEVGDSINRASKIICTQNQARANWISGVSHDIRTPLSMIMGYADRISGVESTGSQTKKDAEIIKNQSIRIKELVQDLNLVSQLEYDMQPISMEKLYLSRILRETATEYLNSGLDVKYELSIDIDENAEDISIEGDKRLIKRAIQNLVSNSINHNSDGCSINLKIEYSNDKIIVSVSDDGEGISDQQLKEINMKPHYLNSTDNRLDLRHGLGLLLVNQIAEVHKAEFKIMNNEHGGCTSSLVFNK